VRRKKALGEVGVGPDCKTGVRRHEVCQKDFSVEKYLLGAFVRI